MASSPRALVAILVLLLSAAVAAAESSGPGEIHVVYLHGSIVEGDDPRPVHPRHGTYDWPAVVAALEGEGFVVHAEQRPAGTVALEAADRLAGQVRELIAAGVDPRSLVVVGHSKGGAIALVASAKLADPEIAWVFLASCFPGFPPEPQATGRVLSVRDTADDLAVPCAPWAERETTSYDELTLATGRGHGLFYTPDPRWLEPVAAWIRKAATGGTPSRSEGRHDSPPLRPDPPRQRR